MMHHLKQKSKNIARNALVGIVKRAGKTLQVLGFSDELIDDVEVFQHVGLASHIPKDAEVIMLPLSSSSKRFFVIASKDQVIEVSKGETVIYDQFQHQIRLNQTGVNIKGNVVIHGNLTANRITARASLIAQSEVTVTGNIIALSGVFATGEVFDKSGSMNAMRVIFNGHGHVVDTTPPKTPMPIIL